MHPAMVLTPHHIHHPRPLAEARQARHQTVYRPRRTQPIPPPQRPHDLRADRTSLPVGASQLQVLMTTTAVHSDVHTYMLYHASSAVKPYSPYMLYYICPSTSPLRPPFSSLSSHLPPCFRPPTVENECELKSPPSCAFNSAFSIPHSALSLRRPRPGARSVVQ